jgi:hypothetical protein
VHVARLGAAVRTFLISCLVWMLLAGAGTWLILFLLAGSPDLTTPATAGFLPLMAILVGVVRALQAFVSWRGRTSDE